MNKTELINKISTDKKYLSICKRLTKGRDYKDLLQELILHFLEQSEDLIQKIRNPDAYIYRTLISLISRRGGFYTKYRTHVCQDIKEEKQEEYNYDSEERLFAWQNTSGTIYWCDREILKIYIEKGTIRKTAKTLNIPLSSIKKIIDRAKKTIKQRIVKPKILIMMQHNITALQYFRQIIPHERLAQTHKEDFEFIYNRPNNANEEPSVLWMADEELKEYKVVIFLRQISFNKDVIQPSIDRLKSLGIKILFDIDDLWDLPKNHYWYDSYIKNNVGTSVTASIKQVDYVTTTTDTFSNIIQEYNNVYVIPNCINSDDPQFKIRKIDSHRIRFAWIGGVFHKRDISLMAESIKKIYQSKELSNKWQLCLGGFNLNPEYLDIEKNLTANYDFRTTDKTYYDYLISQTQYAEHISYDKSYRRLWAKSITSYGELYNETDVCLIPLEDNKFNACKSELKIVEAGTMKKAVIVSNVSPYKQWIKHGVNGLIVNPSRNNIDWFVNMRKLILNPNMVQDLSGALHETIKKNFDLDTHNLKRAELYKSLI